MTENNKPEWLEIAENDGPTVPAKASKKLPLIAVLAVSLILGFGAVVAQLQDSSTTTTSETELAQPIATNNSDNSKLKNPAIAQLPTNGDDEHDEDEDEDEDDD